MLVLRESYFLTVLLNPPVFSRQGVVLIVPGSEDQEYIHEKYMNELVSGVFLAETRERLPAIVERMKERDSIQGLILGGTELPLILREASYKGIPFLDTIRIHMERVIAYLLG